MMPQAMPTISSNVSDISKSQSKVTREGELTTNDSPSTEDSKCASANLHGNTDEGDGCCNLNRSQAANLVGKPPVDHTADEGAAIVCAVESANGNGVKIEIGQKGRVTKD